MALLDRMTRGAVVKSNYVAFFFCPVNLFLGDFLFYFVNFVLIGSGDFFASVETGEKARGEEKAFGTLTDAKLAVAPISRGVSQKGPRAGLPPSTLHSWSENPLRESAQFSILQTQLTL